MAKKRFQDQVQIRPIDINLRTGAARGMMSLAERLGAFERLGQGIAQAGFKSRAEAQVERGVERAGEVALRTPEGELVKDVPFQEETFFNKREAKAYNKALASSYMASLANDNREEITKIFLKNQNNVRRFNDKVKAYYNGVVSGVDPLIKQEVAQDLEKRISLYREKVQINEAEKNKKNSKINITTSLENEVKEAETKTRNGDNKGAAYNLRQTEKRIAELEQSEFITSKQAETMKKDVLRRVMSQNYAHNVFKTYEEKGINTALAQWEDLATGKVPPEFTPDEWRQTTTKIHTDLFRVQRDTLKKSLEQKKAEQKALLIERGKTIVENGWLVDPAKGSDSRKAVEAYFDTQLADWFQKTQTEDENGNPLMTPEEITGNIKNFIKNQSIIPATIISDTSAKMQGGSVTQAIGSARLVSELVHDPDLRPILRDLPDGTRQMAVDIIESERDGLTPEQAVQYARDKRIPLSDAEKETIYLEIDNMIEDIPKTLEDFIDKDPQFDPSWYQIQPETTAALEANYAVNFRKFMRMSRGNAEQSKKLAYQSIQKYWRYTDVGRERTVMQYGPEAMYGRVGIPNDWILAQWERDIKKNGYDPKSVSIQVNTKIPYTDHPKYMVVDEDGAPLYNKKTKELFVWWPEWDATFQAKIMRERNQKSVEESKFKRDEQNAIEYELGHMYDDNFYKKEIEEFKRK